MAFLAILILFISIIIFLGKNDKNDKVKNAAIYNVVKEMFLTDKGYYNELSNHVSQEVFEQTNIYNVYNIDNLDYERPFSIDFKLTSDSENEVNNIIYVKLIYSVNITDSQNKVICDSKDIPIIFTIKNAENNWYISEKE